ncbi:hypothetical protein [Mycolicibacterium pallens]|uniref:Uncharacterized protein n=1 Tax=Mycolicibacterium pallens TaxID=370524 RepID=A0ABX8VNM1_9MYCO|nr:hypothetical protein [Mycolicibacterium pallens]APE15205.1 hypothetical protein BOH72_08190 [Mycobacterium sp. WY10]QYL19410.1 hypothetical protein K0O64_13525 [Mycolicibacterium pallens]
MHDSGTGAQIGDTVILDGSEPTLTYAAGGTRAVVTNTVYTGYSHKTEIAVVDITTGTQLGETRVLDGRQFNSPLINADGVHVLIAVNKPSTHIAVDDVDTTAIVVIDTITGEQAGKTLTVEGTRGYSLTDDDQTHLVITTSLSDLTHITTIDSATGEQTGATLTFPGQILSWPGPTTSADGAHVLFIVSAADETRVVLLDITTATQTGTGVTIAGTTRLNPVSDGTRLTLITAVGATNTHGSSTHVAVIDTSTGKQVGVTTDLTGTVGAGSVTQAGTTVIVETFAGLRATVDTTTGTAVVDVAGFPWGFDLERLREKLQELGQSRLGRLVQTLAYAIAGVTLPVRLALAAVIFWGAIGLGGWFSNIAPPASVQTAATPS